MGAVNKDSVPSYFHTVVNIYTVVHVILSMSVSMSISIFITETPKARTVRTKMFACQLNARTLHTSTHKHAPIFQLAHSKHAKVF